MAGAAAFAAVQMWEKKKEEDGEEMEHATIKKLVAGFAAAEVRGYTIHYHTRTLTIMYLVHLDLQVDPRTWH